LCKFEIQYIYKFIYLKKKNYYKTKILIYICREIYLIDNFKTKFFIKIDIFEFEQIIINIFEQKLYFEFCEKITVFCEIKTRNNIKIRRIVRTTKKKIISIIIINIEIRFSRKIISKKIKT